ncbi:hypothetical protein [Nocardiopsis sp. JB363]|uniref:hypothetical protein n=1 Tax=Nocardiopsis sp. JB363 TaxID=1434837 RepID=UPI00097AAD17|nr:hypothetical protein [Nocardiopsis sp. JB363]SIO84175.1 hypothetical protein BQ8420_00565 [Nocardiopsis sp. JB363]
MRAYRWSIGLAIAAVLLFFGPYFYSHNAFLPGPNVLERFGNDESLTFEVAEGEEGTYAVYSSEMGNGPSCWLYTPDGEFVGNVSRVPGSGDVSFGSWGVQGELETPEPGTHRLHCNGNSDEYALGGTGPIRAFELVKVLVTITAIFVAPSLLLAAVVVAVVTTVRRRSAVRQP